MLLGRNAISIMSGYPFGSFGNEAFKNVTVSKSEGANGIEKSRWFLGEFKGSGNSYDFGARIYDSRLGRWLSVDPMASIQPGWSTYKAFLDNPNMFVDVEGETEIIQTFIFNAKTGEVTITVETSGRLMTDGKIHQVNYSVGGGWYNANAYYDFTTTRVMIDDGDGNLTQLGKTHRKIHNESDEDIKSFGLTSSAKKGATKIDWSYYSKKQVKGGVAFYSKNGQGGETKFTKGLVDLVDIGPILGALTAFSPNDKSVTQAMNAVYKQIKLGNNADALKEALSIMTNIMEFYGDAADKGQSLNEAIKDNKNPKVNKIRCSPKGFYGL
jgi:RHS repeat-associated protein